MTSDFGLLSALFPEEFDKRGRSLYFSTDKIYIYQLLNSK
ncbi:MAG: hypothetical protein H6R00_2476 [Proteobacteria bacterium]|nr:hypothetical protein [Pseudomonadota bacterium]